MSARRLLPLLLLAAAAACGRDREHVYDDPRRPIRVASGEEFEIVLESNPTTGYAWMLAPPPAPPVVHLVETRYVPENEPGDRPLAGAGGHERWRFRALAPGEAVIPLVYVQPWEKAAPEDTTRFRVVVR